MSDGEKDTAGAGEQEALVLVERSGRVARLVLNNPRKRNPLGSAAVRELMDSLRAADGDPDVGAIIVTGSGEAFSAGADLKEFRASADATARENWESGELWGDLMKLVPSLAKPVVASVNGYALAGGTGLTALCDMAVASDRAKFGTPEVNVGLAPLFILPALLRAVGQRHALDLALTGRTIDAQEALRMGLVNRVVPHEELERASMELAEELASKGPFTMRLAKHSFYRIAELDYAAGLDMARAIRGTFFQSDELRSAIDKFFARKSE